MTLLATSIERAFANASPLIPSGPMSSSDAEYQFVERFDPTGVVRSNKKQFATRIENQFALGSCTGQSGTRVFESLMRRAGGPERNLSPFLLYKLAQQRGGLLGQGDTGAVIRDMLDAARITGVCLEEDYPYPATYNSDLPSDEVLALAAQRKLGRFERINIDRDDYRATERAINSAHLEGLSLIAGIRVNRVMFGINGPMSGHAVQWLDTTPAALQYAGNHAIEVEDFDRSIFPDYGAAQIMANSWGTGWGDGGRTAIPTIMLIQQCFELWACRSFAGVEAAPAPDHVLTDAEIAGVRAWAVAHGIARVGLNGFEYIQAAPVGDHFAAAKAEKAGIAPAQYARAMGLPVSAVVSFMASPLQRPLIDALKAELV